MPLQISKYSGYRKCSVCGHFKEDVIKICDPTDYIAEYKSQGLSGIGSFKRKWMCPTCFNKHSKEALAA